VIFSRDRFRVPNSPCHPVTPSPRHPVTPSPPHGFPPEPIYRFQGRAAELLELERAFRGAPAVLLSGMGGMGKTALAREAAAWDITVNAVAPGFVDTEMLGVISPEQRAWGERVIALRRAGKPEEVAAAAVFLASPLASYITGQTLAVDGGWRMT